MAKKFPIHPNHPERICWGCDQFCATDAMACSNERSPHPAELFGDDWLAWGDQQGTPAPQPITAVQDCDQKKQENGFQPGVHFDLAQTSVSNTSD